MVDKSEKFRWFVRVGYLARAVLYSVLGLIALTSTRYIGEGTNGVFVAIEEFPAGIAVLWVLVAGLCAYAVFRIASPLFDIEHEGSDGKGWAKRIGHAGSAIGHLALAWSAYKFATRDNVDGGSAQAAASGIVSMEPGGLVLGVLGLAFIAAAVFQAKKGVTGEFMNRISSQAPPATRALGAIGYVARAVVFLVVGWSLVRVGFLSAGSGEVKTLGDAVASLSDEGFVFNLVAAGLLVFGLFSLILARYRIIPALNLTGRVPSFRA